MKRLKNIFRKWLDVYTKPKPTLKKEAKTTNMTEALWHLVVAGIISGIIGSIA
ncbi:MAG: hypothetical protein HY368_01790, partial [Candidatus Aenigmarchaeota archaeon]|nr:hypothetical protein [Candidatus Aenigmarchaeota archaeon]